MRIAEKVVLITGASGGIGAACAAEFRRKGALLALVARSEGKLREAGGPDALCLPADLREAAARRMVIEQTLSRYGRIDILVNNAGVGVYTPTWKLPLEQVRAMMELNYFAPLDLIQLAFPAMSRQKGGLIVNVSSLAGRICLPWFTTYSASKFALCALTDGLRVELKRHGIGAMTVCPGYVHTNFQANVIGGSAPAALWRTRAMSITAGECARAIVRGVEKDARTVVTPRAGWLLIAFNSLFPRAGESILRRMYERLGMA